MMKKCEIQDGSQEMAMMVHVGIISKAGNFTACNYKETSRKKAYGPQKCHDEIRCKIQGGGQEMAVKVGQWRNNSQKT